MTKQGTLHPNGGYFEEGRAWIALPVIASATGLSHLEDVVADAVNRDEYRNVARAQNGTLYINFFLVANLCLKVNQVFPEGEQVARDKVTALQLSVLEQIAEHTAPPQAQDAPASH
jgi:hypothetical protein